MITPSFNKEDENHLSIEEDSVCRNLKIIQTRCPERKWVLQLLSKLSLCVWLLPILSHLVFQHSSIYSVSCNEIIDLLLSGIGICSFCRSESQFYFFCVVGFSFCSSILVQYLRIGTFVTDSYGILSVRSANLAALHRMCFDEIFYTIGLILFEVTWATHSLLGSFDWWGTFLLIHGETIDFCPTGRHPMPVWFLGLGYVARLCGRFHWSFRYARASPIFFQCRLFIVLLYFII